MNRFIQLHILTPHAFSCLNRDDLNRPKTANFGGVPRLRISSQSLKRSWRTSDVVEAALCDHLGTRTRHVTDMYYQKMIDAGIKEENALNWLNDIMLVFEPTKKNDKQKKEGKKKVTPDTVGKTTTMVFLSKEEQDAVADLVDTLITEKRAPTEDELQLLRKNTTSVDIALFGRMFASKPEYNVDGAVEVSNAFTVHRAIVEDDYFTAVDDINERDNESGAGMIGQQGFGAGIFYTYVNINLEQLLKNLNGDKALAKKAIEAFVKAVLTVTPNAKQRSFASRTAAAYALAEAGDNQPQSLALAFLKPPAGEDPMQAAIDKLKKQYAYFVDAYADRDESGEPIRPATAELNAYNGEGSVHDIVAFAAKALD